MNLLSGLILIVVLAPSGFSADITVRILNAKNGKIMSGQAANINFFWGNYPSTTILRGRPAPNGAVVFNVPDEKRAEIPDRIAITLYLGACSGKNTDFSLQEIVDRGVVAPNTCERKSNFELSPRPGEVVLFGMTVHRWQRGRD